VFARAPGIPSAPLSWGAHGQRFGFSRFVFEFCQARFSRLTLAEEADRRFGNRPASMDGANLLARRPQFFAGGFLGAFHQPTIRDKILYAGKTPHVRDLIAEDPGQELAEARDGLPARERLHLIGFRTPGEGEVEFAQALVVVIAEGHVDCKRLADTRIGKRGGDICAVGLVRQSLADRRQLGLTSGLLAVGSEFGARAGEVTPTTESIAGRPHLGRRPLRVGNPPAPQ
jgi:hypothetical protein